MNNNEIRNTLREMMNAYNAKRAKWIEIKGTDEGFDKWFTKQVLRGN